MNRKRSLIFLVLALNITLLSGCWSQKELNDIAIVVAFGIDKNEAGKYVGTVQIINPANVAATAQGGGAQAAPVTVFSTTGDTITETARRLTTKVSRILTYTHTNIFVIGEELAREEGIELLFDAVDRDPQFRTTTAVIIARDTRAEDLVQILSSIEKVPANKVIKTLEAIETQWGEYAAISVHDVIQSLVSPGKEPAISGFQISGDVNQGKKLEDLQQTKSEAGIQANGLGIFKNGKLIDWFQDEIARGTFFILDKMKGTAVNLDWKEQKDVFVYDLLRQKTEVAASMKNNRPSISINVQAEGQIGEVRIPINLKDPNMILEIEKVIETAIKHEIEAAIQQAQANKTDIFGFGEAVYRSYPSEWKRMLKDWDEVYFPEIEPDITVNAFIRSTELRSDSYLSSLENNR